MLARSSSGDRTSPDRRTPSKRARYRTIAYVFVATTIILQIVLYAIRTFLNKFPQMDQSPQREILLIIATYLLCTILAEPIRLRKYRIKDFIRYPPVWVPVPIGLVLICVLDQWLPGWLIIDPYVPRQNHQISPAWSILFAATTAVLSRCFRLTWRSQGNSSDETLDKNFETPKSKRWIESGEQPITVQDDDLFSRAGAAQIIAEHIMNDERTTALLGPIGSGKTSILNMAFEDFAKKCPTTLVVRSDLWKAHSPDNIPQIIIKDIVSTLEEVCDTVGLRGIPLTYKRLAVIEPSGMLDRFFNIENHSDSLHELDGICSALEALDRRIVLVIEDSGRLPTGFDLAHTSRFLWAIREISRFSTIIAVDPRRTKMDFAKLCDTIEHVPNVPIEPTIAILVSLYDYWTSHYVDLAPHPNNGGSDKLELGMIKRHGIQTYLLGQVQSIPVRMLVSLLGTPRITKQVLRRVDSLWTKLHGEVDLDDLIILTALRSSAPDIFQFIVTNIEVARKTSDGLEDGLLEKFQQQWKKVLHREPNAHAVGRLVDLLGIPQLRATKAPNPGADEAPQGVHLNDKPDYFARIIAGTVSSDEALDQDVLRDIELSRLGEFRNIANRLVQSTRLNDSYMSAWTRFSKPTAKELFRIIDVVIDILLERDGSSVAPDDLVFVALSFRLRECLDDDGADCVENWIESQASRNVSKSLSLASGLLQFCVRACPSIEGTEVIRRISHTLLHHISQDIVLPQDLADVLSVEYPWTVRMLLSEVSTKTEANEIRFIPLLLEAAEAYGEQIIPQLAYLLVHDSSPRVVQSDSGEFIGVVDSSIIDNRLHMLFGGRESDVLRLLSKYSGSDDRCIQIRKEASQRLRDLEHEADVSHSEA